MKIGKIIAVAAFATAATSPAFAGTSTGIMPVTAAILENCTVIATPMIFGSITGVGNSNVDSLSTITLACTPLANYQVGLDNGSNALSGTRRMKNLLTNEYLPYEIYLDGAHAQRWGNNLGVDTKDGNAPLGVAILTAHGRIPTGVTSGSAGAYADAVTVTVNF